MPDSSKIRELCTRIEDKGMLLFSHIHVHTQATIRQQLHIPSQELLIAFFDTTLFHTGEFGLAIGNNGVYWRNYWLNPIQRYFISWDALKHCNIEAASHHIISFNKEYVFDAFRCQHVIEPLVAFLQALQSDTELEMTAAPATNNSIPSHLYEIVRKQFAILEVKAAESLINKIVYILSSPYEHSLQAAKTENHYHEQSAQTILMRLQDVIAARPSLENLISESTALSMKELVQHDAMWQQIYEHLRPAS